MNFRQYRGKRVETPSHTGGVSAEFTEKYKEKKKREHEKGLHASSKDKHKHKKHKDKDRGMEYNQLYMNNCISNMFCYELF